MAKKQGIVKEGNTYTVDTRVVVNGKRIRLHKRGFRTAQDAYVEKTRLINELNNREGIEGYDNFKLLIDLFLNDQQTRIRKSTLHGKELLVKKYLSKYESTMIKDIADSKLLNDFVDETNKMELTTDYKNKIIYLFKEILVQGYNRGHLSSQDIKNVTLILRPIANNEITQRNEITIWSIDDFKKLLNVIPNDSMDKVLFALWGQTGLRVGELRALQAKHFINAEKSIRVEQSASSKAGQGKTIIGPPKTKASIRDVHVTDTLSETLSEYIRIRNLSDNDYLFFVNGRNTPISESTLKRKIQTYTKNADIPFISAHKIRHSNTTWLLSNINSLDEIGEVSARLGHSSKKVTLDIYFHVNKKRNVDILNILDF